MKIILLCPKTPRINYGGIEKFVLKIAKYVKKQGDEVEIFCTSKQPKDNLIGKIKTKKNFFLQGIMFNTHQRSINPKKEHSIGLL